MTSKVDNENVIGQPYPENGLHEERLENDSIVKDTALTRIGSNDPKGSTEFNHNVEIESSFYSKAYAAVSGLFTSCKEAIFGRPRLPNFTELDAAFKIDEQEYVPAARSRNVCDYDIRAAEPIPPTYYERILGYVYSIYERIVLFFYGLFGIDD
jgi:hypothetical protein